MQPYWRKDSVAERFVGKLKNKVKYMTCTSEKFIYWKDIIDKYNNRYERTIKTNPIGVKARIYIYFEWWKQW